jgi:ADP-ribosyl-[dinitrogen reductase] hydrolase
MRITPLAVFTAGLSSSQKLRDIIVADVSMTHPNLIVQDAIICYCEAIHYLLNNPNDKDRAKRAFELALESSNDLHSNETTSFGEKFIFNWLSTSQLLHDMNISYTDPIPEEVFNCRRQIGFIRHAFVLSFYYLLKFQDCKNQDNNFYFDSIRQVIKEGGDTDTNACIVGGMIGALVGMNGIPEEMV